MKRLICWLVGCNPLLLKETRYDHQCETYYYHRCVRCEEEFQL